MGTQPPTERGIAAPAPYFSVNFALARSPISTTADFCFMLDAMYKQPTFSGHIQFVETKLIYIYATGGRLSHAFIVASCDIPYRQQWTEMANHANSDEYIGLPVFSELKCKTVVAMILTRNASEHSDVTLYYILRYIIRETSSVLQVLSTIYTKYLRVK